MFSIGFIFQDRSQLREEFLELDMQFAISIYKFLYQIICREDGAQFESPDTAEKVSRFVVGFK